MIHDSSISPVPTGQGTTVNFPQMLFSKFGSHHLKKFPTTLKTGIMYENWGKKNKEIFHNFSLGHYALHFNPEDFQNFVCENIKEDFKVKDQKITSYNEIDSDYIVDCRGKPKDFKTYIQLWNPLNCALLASLPKKENDVKFTRAVATPDGWCFYIPLPKKTSLGYLFNTGITSVEKATENFKGLFKIDKVDHVFPFSQYVAKDMIMDERVFLNGNKLFFLEPLEATAMGIYNVASSEYWGYMFNSQSKEQTEQRIKNNIFQIQDFILWHYETGSIYDTPFWEYAKQMCNDYLSPDFKKLIKTMGGMSSVDIEKDRSNADFCFGQWPRWTFKIWYDGTRNKLKYDI